MRLLYFMQLSRELNEHNFQAAAAQGNRVGKYVGDSNYPSPCLWGSPFTSLGITQNYHSKLHCEPGEHPFSFITWQDLLCPGSSMEVRHQPAGSGQEGRSSSIWSLACMASVSGMVPERVVEDSSPVF